MPPGSNSIDDDKIRSRCASPEAAEYTLFVRRLVNRPDVPGGQAEILRRAVERGLLPITYKRQTLSEHLSGRYRHGPPLLTTQLIIECLPDHLPKARLWAEAVALQQAAAESQQSGRQVVGDMAWPEASSAGARWERPPNAVPSRHTAPDNHRPLNTVRVTGTVRPGRNTSHAGYRSGAAQRGYPIDPAAEIAELRAECARLTVQVALARDPEIGPVRYTDLSAAFARYQRGRLGQLSDQIDPSAPVMRRALAGYLCAYADLGDTDVTELAIRTRLNEPAVVEILSAARLPTESELLSLSLVLGVELGMVRHLASHARAEARTRGTEDGRTGSV